MKKTATFIKNIKDWQSDAKLFKLSNPVKIDPWDNEAEKTTEFVIVSAVNAPFSGAETYIFPATKNGDVLNWCELNGSFRGSLDHDAALAGLGFKIV